LGFDIVSNMCSINVFKYIFPVTQFLNINQPDTNELARSLKNPPFKKMEQTYIQWISESKIEIENFLKRDIFVPRLLLACFRHLEVKLFRLLIDCHDIC
jgi:hypothetical protein